MPAHILYRRPHTLLAALAVSLSLSLPAVAAPVKVEFLPPEIAPQAICREKGDVSEIAARWKAWDGSTVPDGDPELVLSDARRLRDLAPVGNLELVDKMLVAVTSMAVSKTVPMPKSLPRRGPSTANTSFSRSVPPPSRTTAVSTWPGMSRPARRLAA